MINDGPSPQKTKRYFNPPSLSNTQITCPRPGHQDLTPLATRAASTGLLPRKRGPVRPPLGCQLLVLGWERASRADSAILVSTPLIHLPHVAASHPPCPPPREGRLGVGAPGEGVGGGGRARGQ